MSIKFGDMASVGRVQTPTLALIVKREKEILSFTPKDYWTISAEFQHLSGAYIGRYANKEEIDKGTDENKGNAPLSSSSLYSSSPSSSSPSSQTSEEGDTGSEDKGDKGIYKILEKHLAETLINSIKEKKGVVSKVKTVTKSEKPPLLFSLTELQIVCNKKYGITAEETLKEAQELYETDKAVSYPRTESKHLSTNLAADVPNILSNLLNTVQFDMSKVKVDGSNKRIFDDSKFTDHHALIPTGNTLKSGTEKKKKVYSLICERFISAFYPDFVYTSTVAYTKVNEYYFKTTGKAVLSSGWREIQGGTPKDITMPLLNENDSVTVSKATLEEKQTTPPDRYTESEILKSMENIGRFVEGEEYRKILKTTSGLGTPATRADIIEKLKKRYLTVEKNKLIPNPKGTLLIDTLKGSSIVDPIFTATMERELEEDPEIFMQNAVKFTKEFVAWAKGLNITPIERNSKFAVVGVCPECGAEVVGYDTLFSCKKNKKENGSCNFHFWRNGLEKLGKKSVTDTEAQKLLLGQAVQMNFKSAAGKKYTADVRLVKGDKGYKCKVEFKQ